MLFLKAVWPAEFNTKYIKNLYACLLNFSNTFYPHFLVSIDLNDTKINSLFILKIMLN